MSGRQRLARDKPINSIDHRKFERMRARKQFGQDFLSEIKQCVQKTDFLVKPRSTVPTSTNKAKNTSKSSPEVYDKDTNDDYPHVQFVIRPRIKKPKNTVVASIFQDIGSKTKAPTHEEYCESHRSEGRLGSRQEMASDLTPSDENQVPFSSGIGEEEYTNNSQTEEEDYDQYSGSNNPGVGSMSSNPPYPSSSPDLLPKQNSLPWNSSSDGADKAGKLVKERESPDQEKSKFSPMKYNTETKTESPSSDFDVENKGLYPNTNPFPKKKPGMAILSNDDHKKQSSSSNSYATSPEEEVAKNIPIEEEKVNDSQSSYDSYTNDEERLPSRKFEGSSDLDDDILPKLVQKMHSEHSTPQTPVRQEDSEPDNENEDYEKDEEESKSEGTDKGRIPRQFSFASSDSDEQIDYPKSIDGEVHHTFKFSTSEEPSLREKPPEHFSSSSDKEVNSFKFGSTELIKPRNKAANSSHSDSDSDAENTFFTHTESSSSDDEEYVVSAITDTREEEIRENRRRERILYSTNDSLLA